MTWNDICVWLDERPYNPGHTEGIIQYLRAGNVWEWETFEAFFKRDPSKAVVLATNLFKMEFLEGVIRYVSNWFATGKVGIGNSGPMRHYVDKPSLMATLDAFTGSKTFFHNLGDLRIWSQRCIICQTTNGSHIWYTPPTGQPPQMKPKLAIYFEISPDRFDQIAVEFGWDTRENGMLGICTGCPHACIRCGTKVNVQFDVNEMREFVATKECIICGKYNLARAEYPKPNRNTWKNIARRKDLTP